MKKLLALVLALVMTLSLCTISNAAFTDAKDVDASYEEAVAVLNGMGVFKGYEDGSFKPEGSITRAEVAAIVYRLYTGDVKDKQAGLYAGYGKFDDMAGATWAAGYIGFCANAGFVKGYGDGKFGPSDPVTGYQALAMILRAVGYGKNGEFEGADWELHVAQIAQQLKVLKNVKGVSLKAAASRELVAELLFQVAANVPTVTYTPAFGYVTADIAKDVKDETLGWKNFYLAQSDDGEDAWGRPSYKWFEDKNGNEKVDSKETKYATIADKPVMTFTEATTYCDICEELGESKKAEVETVWTNGVKDTKHADLSATATKAVMGAQGELVEVYEKGDEYRFVVIDTYLAKVTDVKDAKLDSAGHVKTEAKLTLEVYGWDQLTLEGEDGENFDYEKDEYVLVYVNEEDEQSSEIVEVVEPTAMKYTGISNKAFTEIKLDGTWEKFACKYAYDFEAIEDDFCKIKVFFDLYGNVIGTLKIDDAKTVSVIDAMYTVTVKGKSTFKADIVGTDAEMGEFEIDEVHDYRFGNPNLEIPYGIIDVDDVEEKASENEEKYPAAYDKLYTYTTDEDGVLTLEAVKIGEDSTVDTKAATRVTYKDRWLDAKDTAIKFNDETVFLIHENDGSYTSVMGDEIGDIYASNVEYMEKSGYATVVYLYGYIFRAEDLTRVYVTVQDMTRMVNQKVDGETVKCLKVNYTTVDGDSDIAYFPLPMIDEIAEALGSYYLEDVGGIFVDVAFVKGTKVVAEYDIADYYDICDVTDVTKGTVVLNGSDTIDAAVSLAKIDKIYVIEDGEITKGDASDVKEDTMAHVFWAEKNSDYVVDELYIDLDLTAAIEEELEDAKQDAIAELKAKAAQLVEDNDAVTEEDLEEVLQEGIDAINDAEHARAVSAALSEALTALEEAAAEIQAEADAAEAAKVKAEVNTAEGTITLTNVDADTTADEVVEAIAEATGKPVSSITVDLDAKTAKVGQVNYTLVIA